MHAMGHALTLTGWSHFAQFTIAVVNKDPKKSKYSGWSAAEVHAAIHDSMPTATQADL